MALCSDLSFFVLWHCHTLFGKWVHHYGTMCRVHSWTLYDLDLWPHIKIIFSPWIWVWQDVSALWHRHTKFDELAYAIYKRKYTKKFRYMLFVNPEEKVIHEDKKTRSSIYAGIKTLMLAIVWYNVPVITAQWTYIFTNLSKEKKPII